MRKKNKNVSNKRKSSKPENRLHSPLPVPSSQQLERLRLLVEKRFDEEQIDREELFSMLSAEYQSTNEFIEHTMLIMLIAEKVNIPLHFFENSAILLNDRKLIYRDKMYNLADDDQLKTTLLTDTRLIDALIENNLLIDAVFEYVFDPIKLNSELVEMEVGMAISIHPEWDW